MSTRHSVAKNENRFSFIVATLVASVQPKNEKRQINVPMEVLLSDMLVRRTERADGSTRQLEHRSVSERLAGRSVCQSVSGSMTGRWSRHRRSAASAVSRRRIGQGVGTISCSEPDRLLLVLPCRCPPWRAKRRMLADVFHWRQIRFAVRRIMRVHR